VTSGPSPQPPPAAAATGKGAGTRLRPVAPEDHAAVTALFERHGWPVRSREGWNWALFDSPARVATGADAGWVLEHGERVVGFLGNLPVRAVHDGQPLWGATCTSYLVDDGHRAHSTRLLRAFAAQPGASLVWSATANPNSAPVYRGFRFRPFGGAAADQRLRWIGSEPALAESLLRRLGLASIAPLGRALAAPWAVVRRARELPPSGPALRQLRIQRLWPGDLVSLQGTRWARAWDAWAQALCASPGLWVDRSAATMAWRLGDPDLLDELALWAVIDAEDRMLGMGLARELPRQRGQLSRAELVDLALLPRAPAGAAQLLLREVCHWARGLDLAVVDAKRWTGRAAALLAATRPRTDPLPADGVWLMTHDRPGTPGLPAEPEWAMTGADSDDWFCTQRSAILPDRKPWRAMPQPPQAADSSAIRSSSDTTAAGSKRSMSTA
jgi:hypothetical protein